MTVAVRALQGDIIGQGRLCAVNLHLKLGVFCYVRNKLECLSLSILVNSFASRSFRFCTIVQAPCLTHKHQTKLLVPASDKHSSLLRTFVNDSRKKCYNIGYIFHPDQKTISINDNQHNNTSIMLSVIMLSVAEPRAYGVVQYSGFLQYGINYRLKHL